MNKYIDWLRLKIKGYVIIDDFFPEEICEQLRYKSLNCKKYKNTYWDYKAIDFDDAPSDDSLKDIADDYVSTRFSLIEKEDYIRSWSFIYDNAARGVMPHADPSFVNVNVWVTPDECVLDHNKNGLLLYNRRAPKHWGWKEYNSNSKLINDFLKGSKYDRIPYKCNRAIIFRGNIFHSTDSVRMKPGLENKRVNYTFLYDG